ncbi:hypothetical protein DL93DRAFT_1583167 [Clavulina sp. PMI_390]|nr:hypothetical protein DL93DRAFT_1583167 [Clavulina sp. PMI_390]
MHPFSLVAFGLFSAFASATPTRISRSDTVLTPKGFIPAENVRHVPQGGHVLHAGSAVHVVDASNNIVDVRRLSTTNTSLPANQTGWVAYGSWLNTLGHPITNFETTWTVPPVPASQVGQTLFLFNSIEPWSFDSILQPVLQYGGSAAGGGAYWSVASWYGANNTYFHTTPVEVAPGTVLKGVMQLTNHTLGDVGNYTYQAYFEGIPGTTMIAKNAEELKWATETLEVYGINSTSDFPEGSTVFSNINLRTTRGHPEGIEWSTVSSTEDGTITTVNVQGSRNATITIEY